jgi:RNA polymerase sigma factor (sigma-70 family)
MHPDHKYIAGLLDADSDVIDEIYALHANKIIGWVRKNGGSVEDAKDVFQDALISIVQQAQKPGWELTCPFSAFLFLVCQRRWYNELQRRKREKVTLERFSGFEVVDDAEQQAEHALRDYQEFLLFQKAFNELKDDCKNVLSLSWSGIPQKELAEQLGYTYGYFRKKKTLCLAALISLIKSSEDFRKINEE